MAHSSNPNLTTSIKTLGFLGGSVVKNSLANAGDSGLISGSGRFPRVGDGNPSSIFAWKISWTEKPGRLQLMESQRVGHG